MKTFYSGLQILFSNHYKLPFDHIDKCVFHIKLSHLDFTLQVNCIFIFLFTFKFEFLFFHSCFIFINICPYLKSLKEIVSALCILYINSYLQIFSKCIIFLLTILIITFPITNFVLVYIQIILQSMDICEYMKISKYSVLCKVFIPGWHV